MEELFHLFKSDMGFLESLGYSVLGLLVVFLMLIILMVVIKIMGGITNRAETSKVAPIPRSGDEVVTISAEDFGITAPGSAGEIKLYDVPPKTAAMIMAIVADQMGKPLNELRFISIREVK